MTMRYSQTLCLMTGVLVAVQGIVTAADAPQVDFEREIRPLLSNRCFQCHGPDANAREAELRLDSRDDVFGEAERDAVVVPGNAAESELFRRISATDPDERMPPADSQYEPFNEQEIELVRRWIESGAEWKQHWAFITPTRPDPPDVGDPDWPVNPIDAFTLQSMYAHDLEPMPQASKETLIRRATLDLTGLPPTVAEVDAFLADASPNAYERVVDRLLDSTRYGEHMTRYWLDTARYGDTHGLHLDNVRSIWPYRDWLIQAFNENRPFDQMIVEQLAGDLLPNATVEQKVATGFNRCNVTTSEGGSIAEEYYVRYTVDRVETMGTVFMGLTVGCAVCHDHKFDPISMKDFYGLFAFYNSFNENPMDGNALLHPPFIEVPTEEQRQKRDALKDQLAEVNRQIDEALAAVEYTDPHAGAAAESIPRSEFVWFDDAVPAGAKQESTGHDWEFVSAPAPVFSGTTSTKRSGTELTQHVFSEATAPLNVGEGDKLFAYVRLDPDDPPQQIMLQWNDGAWEHRAFWGEDLIPWGTTGSASRLRVGDLPAAGEWVRLEVDAAAVGLAARAKVNGLAFTQSGGTAWWDYAGIVTRTPQAGHSFDSQRLWELAVGEGKDLPGPVREALKVAPADRNEQQAAAIRKHYLEYIHAPTRDSLASLHEQRSAVEADLKAANDAIPKTLVSEELPEPKPAYLLKRGDYDKKGDEVGRQVPSALPPLPAEAPLNRLGLAQWLVDPSHPLTARVTMNRWWQRYFGTGLVKTAEDFGIQGETPSHPELLDWLAVEFRESGWDVKHMQKLIVMSATYRQSSAVTPDRLAKDPYNRYLSHGPRFRMDAEMIRDTALFVSGLLNPEIGGPSVKPYQPGGLWEAVGYTSSNTAKFQQDAGDKLYRRSMYTFWKRTSHPPSMAVLDAPSREACTVRRPRTNTPLQALTLMNDKQFVEAARHFAQRILKDGGETNQSRLTYGFRAVTAREPTEHELQVLSSALVQQQTEFSADPASASALIDSATTQPEPAHQNRDKTQDPQLAAWTMIANLLLNLDETLTKG